MKTNLKSFFAAISRRDFYTSNSFCEYKSTGAIRQIKNVGIRQHKPICSRSALLLFNKAMLVFIFSIFFSNRILADYTINAGSVTDPATTAALLNATGTISIYGTLAVNSDVSFTSVAPLTILIYGSTGNITWFSNSTLALPAGSTILFINNPTPPPGLIGKPASASKILKIGDLVYASANPNSNKAIFSFAGINSIGGTARMNPVGGGVFCSEDPIALDANVVVPESDCIIRWSTLSGMGTFSLNDSKEDTTSLTNLPAGADTIIVELIGKLGRNNVVVLTKKMAVTIHPSNTWMGYSSNWNDPINWCSTVPGLNSNVLVPASVSFYPIVDNYTALVRDLTIANGASVTVIGTGVFQIAGAISNTGMFDATEGTIEMKGANNQIIPANAFNNNTLLNLIIANTGGTGVSLQGPLNITGNVSFGNVSGKILSSNGFLVLKSTVDRTASVANYSNNGLSGGNDIVGDVIVERYLLNARKWRLLSAPTNDATQSIRSSWQENGIMPAPAGYGFQAADTRADWSERGFDLRGNNTSVKVYNGETDAWDAVANTTSPIKNNLGYIVFVAGDRSVDFPNSNATTLRTKGKLYKDGDGELSTAIPVPAGQFKVIGNPFASAIDIRLVNKTNLDLAYYVWDPSLGGAYGLGAFMTFVYDGTDYRNFFPSPIYPAGVHNNVESGAAFIVRSTIGGDIKFTESAKTSVSSSTPVMFVSGAPQGIRLNLNLAGTTPLLLDGAMVNFDDAYSNQIDELDIRKMATLGESVAWKTNNTLLVIERRFIPAESDTLHIDMSKMTVRNYQWEINSDNMDFPGRQAFLLDSYLNTSIPLNMAGTTTVNFSIQNIPASYAPDRFKIVFKQLDGGPLPVTITHVAANRNADKTVAVQWKVQNELNLTGYEVQRSPDGITFSTLVKQLPNSNAGGSATYVVVDGGVAEGNLFYRIKANSLGGQVQYSAIVKVATLNTNTGIKVYPNPVQNNQMNIQFIGQEKGRYSLRLINKLGQVVYSGSVIKTDNNFTKSIQLGEAVGKGIYHLSVQTASGTINTQKIVIE